MAGKPESQAKDRKENQIVIDASHATLGRLASFAAKKILTGTKIVVVNCGNAVVIGNRKAILAHYSMKRARGKGSLKGPYFPKKAEAILKRTIRGMLPKSSSGRTAFKNLLCYSSVPSEYAKSKKVVSKRQKSAKFVTLEEISKLI